MVLLFLRFLCTRGWSRWSRLCWSRCGFTFNSFRRLLRFGSHWGNDGHDRIIGVIHGLRSGRQYELRNMSTSQCRANEETSTSINSGNSRGKHFTVISRRRGLQDATGSHPLCLTNKMQRDGHFNRFIDIDFIEVDMDRRVGKRVALDLFQQC